ncbi:MAG TPA: class I SAM-dependent methyltransferase [Verrucomicrobiae bacterium]|nr:class I SAM-dependent methyltransferase [Verrucomicrobiae bacterium]
MNDSVWKSHKLVSRYLRGVRGAIPLAQTQIEVMLQLLATRRRPIRRFLDLGCGDGILGAAILEAFPKASGLFVDFSKPMLEACRARLARKHVTTLLLDYGNPGWIEEVLPQGPFDAIVSGYSIHHQPDKRKQSLYREIYRLLALNGWFVNLEHVASTSPITKMLFDEQMVEGIHRRQPKLNCATVRRRYVNRADKTANILAPVERQCQWLRTIGFVDVDCYFKLYELAVFGGRKDRRG